MKKPLIPFFILSVGLFSFPLGIYSFDNFEIAVILSKEIGPYREAVQGFEQNIRDSGFTAQYTYYDLEKNAGFERVLADRILSLGPDLIYVVGTQAAVFAKNHIKKAPVIFSMVLDPVESKVTNSYDPQGRNMTGVALKIGVEDQFKTIKQLIPSVRKIGMLYNVDSKQVLRDEAAAAAEALGLELIAKAVDSKSDVNIKLEEVLKEADCLWAGVDTLIYNPLSVQHISLSALRKRKPFMAFSSYYVNAGALLALECDYTDIGGQSALLALRILNGEPPGNIPISFPRKVNLITNKKTAEILNIELS